MPPNDFLERHYDTSETTLVKDLEATERPDIAKELDGVTRNTRDQIDDLDPKDTMFLEANIEALMHNELIQRGESPIY